ncbi:hypothetical protein T492DRAFT_841126 [Pavlovales sp. CCMP2436]|nr:hypothetical protein T492DRAFT_841126 [Pavlovales sp. CCMP2436]
MLSFRLLGARTPEQLHKKVYNPKAKNSGCAAWRARAAAAASDILKVSYEVRCGAMLAWAVMVASALLASAALADNGLLPPPLACGPLPRAIALITGFARASSRAMAALEANAELLGAHVLAPLDADVVLVYEAGSCAGARVSPAAGCTTESLEALVETALIRKLGR